jgi:hypothetical protein
MRISPAALVFSLVISACSAQDIPDLDIQISHALLALPDELRDGAAVLGYKNDMKLTEIRKGSNSMICLADDPSKDGFSVAAYHKDLDPFMERGRALRLEGKSAQEIFDIREQEVASGKLNIPSGSVLYIATGTYDDQEQPTNIYQRFVVYIPYATTESTGLALKPSYPGGPWIMNPGTHRAHIMINPPMVDTKKD